MKCEYIDEPRLEFGFQQKCDDPRDGLSLYGAIDAKKVHGISLGVIGCPPGIENYRHWVKRIQQPVYAPHNPIARPFFPGFEAVFGIQWDDQPLLEIELSLKEIEKLLKEGDRQKRVATIVQYYADRIIEATRTEENRVPVWYVIVPKEVKSYCRPQSPPMPSDNHRIQQPRMSKPYRRSLLRSPSLFQEENEFAEALRFRADFRKQIKARLLEHRIVTQIVLESTLLEPEEFSDVPRHREWMREQQSAIAWNLSAATFYKHGARPWRLADIRKGVCYVGLVFKKLMESEQVLGNACCAAQMFLDSGDGVVFRGAVGPWHSEKDEYHLDETAAHDLIKMVADEYERHHGFPPAELFIHGRTYFNDEEWNGFRAGVPSTTSVVGVRIRKSRDIRLFTTRNSPVLRGTAINLSRQRSLLWTGGFVPRLRTQIGLEVPNPLQIDVCRGSSDWKRVVTDILGLTKLNYNSCMYADSLPVTLRFADMVGDILVAGPTSDLPPLQFYHYI